MGNYNPNEFDKTSIVSVVGIANVIAAWNTTYKVNANPGIVSITLPAADPNSAGKKIEVFRLDATANAITINAGAGNTINGAASVTITAQYDSVIIRSDGTNAYRMLKGPASAGGLSLTHIVLQDVLNPSITSATGEGLNLLSGGGAITIGGATQTTNIVLGNSSAGQTVHIAAGVGVSNVNIAQSSSGSGIIIGNNNGATTINNFVGTGGWNLTGVASSPINIGLGVTTGSIGIGTSLTSGSLIIASNLVTGQISIGNGNSQTGSIQIGAGTGAKAVQVGGSATALTLTGNTILIGNVAAGSITLGQNLTTGSIVMGGAMTSGTIQIGGSNMTGAINIGYLQSNGHVVRLGGVSGAVNQTVFIGDSTGTTGFCTINVAGMGGTTGCIVNIGAAATSTVTGSRTINILPNNSGGALASSGNINIMTGGGTFTGPQTLNIMTAALGAGGSYALNLATVAGLTATIGSNSAANSITINGGTTINGVTLQTAINTGGVRTFNPAAVSNTHVVHSFQAAALSAAVIISGGVLSFVSASDRRLKTNIRDTLFTLDDLLKIKVRDFEVRANGETSTGVIAQEIIEVVPGVVSNPDDGTGNDVLTPKDAWSVAYGNLTPHLIKAVQDLTKIVLELKARMDANG